MSAYKPHMIGDLNMDDLADARAYFEKEYRAESTLFNGSKIAAGQYRRYADAVAQAVIKLGTQADLTAPLAQSIGIVRDRDHYKARCERLFAAINKALIELGGIGVDSSKEFHRIGIDSTGEILSAARDAALKDSP